MQSFVCVPFGPRYCVPDCLFWDLFGIVSVSMKVSSTGVEVGEIVDLVAYVVGELVCETETDTDGALVTEEEVTEDGCDAVATISDTSVDDCVGILDAKDEVSADEDVVISADRSAVDSCDVVIANDVRVDGSEYTIMLLELCETEEAPDRLVDN